VRQWRQRGIGAVIGDNSDCDLVSATRVDGHGSGVFLGWPRPTSARRGHKHPCGKKRLLRNGPELGDAADCHVNSEFPGLDRMFMARPHRRALAYLGFWVQGLLSQRGESAPA
jgi:hypothetical protein